MAISTPSSHSCSKWQPLTAGLSKDQEISFLYVCGGCQFFLLKPPAYYWINLRKSFRTIVTVLSPGPFDFIFSV